MKDRELFEKMADAARLATDAAMAAGYSRADKVTRDSARRASEDVYLAERGVHEPAQPRKVDQPVEDPLRERMEREP